MSSFVERVVDVIGADPNIPDSVFREMFSAAGDMYVPPYSYVAVIPYTSVLPIAHAALG